jgi:hypothetical protein
MRSRIAKLLAAAAVTAGMAVAPALTATAHASTITSLPGQPAITDYQPPSGNGSNAVPYEHQGALIVAGQSQLPSQPMKDASAAGATVMAYLDPMIIQPNSGTYGDMLWQSSACGPAPTQWGTYNSGSAPLADFRTTADGGNGIEQAKLKCVLEKMVSDNPWIGGLFADDLGSMSWYPGIPWGSFGSANQQAWRDGAIALAQTFHDVAVEHGLAFMVNGTWEAGTLASSGGGYPTLATHGLSLADGGYIEHHAASELSFWTAYAQGQWGTATGDVSQGHPFMYVQAPDQATMNTYNNAGVFSFLSYQTDYSQPAPVWGSFHATGLPSSSGGTVQQAPVVVTNAATGITSTGATLNGTVNPQGADASYKFDYGTTTSYGSSTTGGDAGSGTTAVAESAPLTGLTPSTVYHYRIEATNSAGTTLGSDQQFTTSAAGGTSVAYDASASGHITASTTLQWTHTVGSGANRALVTEVSVGINNDAGCYITMTDNGTVIPWKGLVHADNQSAGFVSIYGMANPPSGVNTLKAVTTSCAGGTPNALSAGSVSFSGASQSTPFGAAVSSFGYSATPSLSVPSAASDLIVSAVANGSQISSVQSPGTSRFIVNVNNNTGAGNSAGGTWPGTGSNVTTAWNVASDWWGAIALQVQHS